MFSILMTSLTDKSILDTAMRNLTLITLRVKMPLKFVSRSSIEVCRNVFDNSSNHKEFQ